MGVYDGDTCCLSASPLPPTQSARRLPVPPDVRDDDRLRVAALLASLSLLTSLSWLWASVLRCFGVGRSALLLAVGWGRAGTYWTVSRLLSDSTLRVARGWPKTYNGPEAGFPISSNSIDYKKLQRS